MSEAFELFAAFTTLAALGSWLNHRLLRLPPTIALLLLGLVFSLAVGALGRLGFPAGVALVEAFRQVDFTGALLDGMLGALLFAGALHVNLQDLREQKLVIGTLATAGVLISTSLVALGLWLLCRALGVELDFVWCLVFGALISPTDPIAVLGILKQTRVPKTLETKIAGESLFNDGVGIVVFLVLAELARGAEPSAGHVVGLLVLEAGGGVALGLLLGGVAFLMLRSVDRYQVEALVTLALVTGGYALANALHTSGPLAMVVAGLFIGNHGRTLAMSDRTRERLDDFWELVDEFLNALLFVMIGAEVLLLVEPQAPLAIPVLAIPLVLLARAIAVGTPVSLLRRIRDLSPHAIKLLTWGGLRGGISVALALSLPPGPERDLLLLVTYVVVCFSIVVQGLSMGPLVTRLYPGESRAA